MTKPKGRIFLNPTLLFSTQRKLIEKFRKEHICVRLKGRRICLLRENGVNLFKFDKANGLRKETQVVVLSDEAVDAMTYLLSDERNREYVKEHQHDK